MTVALRPRLRNHPEPATTDLADEGIHRDPGAHDPIATGGFAQRLVHRASTALGGGKTTRRSFLTRTAVVGSALAVGPIDFLLKPGTAYGYVCGTCSDGWTAFCCTINSGRNSCPPGSFIAGWWKADNAAYCCGAARYIIDCNATCPTQCACRCAGGACDGRKTCCNQFRYGQCHQEIACYGPVVCRVATCTVPWRYDPSCTTASATDNRTTEHGAPCLTTDCGTPIARKYAELGGPTGRLGPVVQGEHAIGDSRGGRRARYQNGNIYWTSATGAHEVRGSVLTEYGACGGVTGALGYPVSDTIGPAESKYCTFEKGRIYVMQSNGARYTVPNPFFTEHQALGSFGGQLGYPTSQVKGSADGRAIIQDFQKGRVYWRGNLVTATFGSFHRWYETAGGSYRGPFGHPAADVAILPDGRGLSQWFEKGIAWHAKTTGTHGLRGGTLSRYAANGHALGKLGYPTAGTKAVGDGRGTFATFERGHIYALSDTVAHQVNGTVLTYYLQRGGPKGALGYPTSELTPPGRGRRFQSFENGRIEYLPDTTVIPA
jgi:hypothetical protein